MIESIIDNDLYKFTMQYAVLKKFPKAKVKYEFINRGKTRFPEGFAEELRKQVKLMANLNLSDAESTWMENRCYYLDPSYFDFLRGYRYNPDEVTIEQNGGDVSVHIQGYWYRTILWEVPLMAIISQLYFEMTDQKGCEEAETIKIAQEKALKFEKLGIKLADFGTRRRYSFKNHERIVKTMSQAAPQTFTGSSNLYFAMQNHLTPIGTHAHEWFMFHAALFGFKMANFLSLQNWVSVFRGNLGIALSDTYTTQKFFDVFDTMFAKLFDGVRHDSGDPIEFADRTIEHYKNLRIDPKSKMIVFSDGLDYEAVEKIQNHCKGKINTFYGIGTNLTNDVGVKPLNIVIKITEAMNEGCEWTHTVKLSDVQGKYTGDQKMIVLCKQVLDIT